MKPNVGDPFIAETCEILPGRYPCPYIELNPVRAGMVNEPGDYQWSSYRVHGFGLRTKMWTPHATYLALGQHVKARQSAYRNLMNEALDADVIVKIRHCINTGLVLGSEAFRNQVASLHN